MKRFYREVSVEPAPGGWCIALDKRALKTARGAAQVIPSLPLAEAMAAEWAQQADEIDSAGFVFRDLADYAIDVIAPDRPTAIGGLLAFGESDTLCYRADPEDALFRRQEEVWEPLLGATEARHGLRFERVSGIIHRKQPPETLARLHALLETQDDFTLAALSKLASLAASLAIALTALKDGTDAELLWDAANLEEDWQAAQWGWDPAAKERRDNRHVSFTRACAFLDLVRSGRKPAAS